MKNQSFLYQQKSVFNSCLKALRKRDYNILNSDCNRGIIQASTGNGFFEPKVLIEINVMEIADDSSHIKITSKLVKKSIFKRFQENLAEEKFLDTLYKFVTKESGFFPEFNQGILKAA
ncbi:MAG: hypothetical protein IPJ86_17030 [Bacteroidetes bacterium]|jgi:hypothetical protein|nr:hypothetical protein [Bacteroidota bacterium]MBK9318431.1 hypothetical protein [Bacteroidota bacterium]